MNKHGEIGFDTTHFDPTIRYEGGEAHVASREFSGRQGRSGWRYGYLENGRWHDLTYYADAQTWRFKEDNATHTPFVARATQHPHTEQDAVREWTAPHAGTRSDHGLRLQRAAMRACPSPAAIAWRRPAMRLGTPSSIGKSKDGLVIGWDYMGHWASSFAVQGDGTVNASLRVAGHKQSLLPGQSVTTPKAFVALFRDDLDNAGNEFLDWQYRYLWDYTRDGWFPAVPMLGYWYKGTGWGKPGVSWVGGQSDIASQFTKVFRAVDLMREVGGDVYHRDWGWWDRAGDWNGPDFGTTNRYLQKYGMHQLVYAFLYTVDRQSKVAREHPDWLLGETLDMSRPEVVAHIKAQLENFHDRWGDFAWRNDSTPTSPEKRRRHRAAGPGPGLPRDHPELPRRLSRDRRSSRSTAAETRRDMTTCGYRRCFSSATPPSASCATITRRSSFLPTSWKTTATPGTPTTTTRRPGGGSSASPIMTTGDTWDKSKLEGLRQLFDIYHYLAAQGVVGRWVKVYRPRVEGDDPTMYFERLSGDRLPGTDHPQAAGVRAASTIHPKGLLRRRAVTRSPSRNPRPKPNTTGAELMKHGIAIDRMLPGELIYLNLPLHPGSTRDHQPPTAPRQCRQATGREHGLSRSRVAVEPRHRRQLDLLLRDPSRWPARSTGWPREPSTSTTPPGPIWRPDIRSAPWTARAIHHRRPRLPARVHGHPGSLTIRTRRSITAAPGNARRGLAAGPCRDHLRYQRSRQRHSS